MMKQLGERNCPKCGKLIENLHSPYCRLCNAEWQRNYRKSAKYRQWKLGRGYRISLADYTLLIHASNGCAICHAIPNPPQIDHDHLTNKVRGILCKNCNLALGLFTDSADLLASAISYLSNPPAEALSDSLSTNK